MAYYNGDICSIKKIIGIQDLSLEEIRKKTDEGYIFLFFYIRIFTLFSKRGLSSSVYFVKTKNEIKFIWLSFVIVPFFLILILLYLSFQPQIYNISYGQNRMLKALLIFVIYGVTFFSDLVNNCKGYNYTDKVLNYLENNPTVNKSNKLGLDKDTL